MEAKIQQRIERAQSAGAAEDKLCGAASSGEEMPQELSRRENRITKIREAKAALEEGAQLIVAAAVGDNAAGNGYRIEMLDQVK